MAPARSGPGEPNRLGEQAPAHRVETVIAAAAPRAPLAHLLDEGRRPDGGVSAQRGGRQQRIERLQNPLLLVAPRDMLEHRTGKAKRLKLPTKQGGQETA